MRAQTALIDEIKESAAIILFADKRESQFSIKQTFFCRCFKCIETVSTTNFPTEKRSDMFLPRRRFDCRAKRMRTDVAELRRVCNRHWQCGGGLKNSKIVLQSNGKKVDRPATNQSNQVEIEKEKSKGKEGEEYDHCITMQQN